jgi:branched-chain amino acid transport system permease protein
MVFFLSQVPIAAIYVIVAMGLDLAVSVGLLSLAVVALMGIGSYSTAWLSVNEGWPFVPTILVGMIVATIVGVLASLPGLRVRGFVYGVISFAFAIVLATAFNVQNAITNGANGIVGVPTPNAFGYAIRDNAGFSIVFAILAVLVFFVRWRIGRSTFGLTLRSLRNESFVGAINGVNARWSLIQVMAVSSALAALGGSLYAGFIQFVGPTAFTVDEGFVLLIMVILGGQGNALGAALGAIVISVIPGLMTYLPLGSTNVGAWSQIIYAVLLLVMLRLRPRGLIPEGRWLTSRHVQSVKNLDGVEL